MTVLANFADKPSTRTTHERVAEQREGIVLTWPEASAPSSASFSYRIAKRLLDLIVTVPLIVFSLPLMLLIAGMIRLDSKGPVLFLQTRLGRDGKSFDIFKFRTMHVLENGSVIAQAKKDDPRITRMGRFLRRSSLDELPQFFNVLRGEMSIVGPRPHARAHDRLYSVLIRDYVLRQTVKPGITGWAQIHGARGETPTLEAMARRIALDCWYARHASLSVDFRILARTPLAILRARNAH